MLNVGKKLLNRICSFVHLNVIQFGYTAFNLHVSPNILLIQSILSKHFAHSSPLWRSPKVHTPSFTTPCCSDFSYTNLSLFLTLLLKVQLNHWHQSWRIYNGRSTVGDCSLYITLYLQPHCTILIFRLLRSLHCEIQHTESTKCYGKQGNQNAEHRLKD